MPALLLGLLKYVPFLGGLLEKFTADKGRAAEIQAEKELIEAKAFARGRISPKYLMKYAMVAVFCFLSLGILFQLVFGGDVSQQKSVMNGLIKSGIELLNAVEW